MSMDGLNNHLSEMFDELPDERGLQKMLGADWEVETEEPDDYNTHSRHLLIRNNHGIIVARIKFDIKVFE